MTVSQIDLATHASDTGRPFDRLGELACAALGFAVVAAIWVAFLLFVAGQLTPPHVG